MSAMNYSTIVPTVTNGTCASGSSCAAGSLCTSTSQCATGNCCGYIYNMGSSSSVSSQYSSSISAVNTETNVITVNSMTAFTALMNNQYYINRYCFSNVNGSGTTTNYNTTSGVGYVTASNLTSVMLSYLCTPIYAY